MRVTVTVRPSASPTAFDLALAAGLAAGWPWRPAFDAVCVMLAHGMTAAEVQAAFCDAARRSQ
jgi:hypothetical protein